jgi:hypothetical protein
MNDGGCAILEATIDGAAKLRRDVAGGGTSAEFSGTEGCGKNKTEEDEQALISIRGYWQAYFTRVWKVRE